jgi:DNA-directed RNA polymerase specialized sigma24 family protein
MPTRTGDRTNGELLELFAGRREQAAFAELVRRYGPAVLAVCRKMLRHEQDAEDVAQATFLVLARKSGSIRNPAALSNWLCGVAFRLAVRAAGPHQRGGRQPARLRNGHRLLPPGPGPQPTPQPP